MSEHRPAEATKSATAFRFWPSPAHLNWAEMAGYLLCMPDDRSDEATRRSRGQATTIPRQ